MEIMFKGIFIDIFYVVNVSILDICDIIIKSYWRKYDPKKKKENRKKNE